MPKIMLDRNKQTYFSPIFDTKYFGGTWLFDNEEEAELAEVMAKIAQKNNISINSLQHLLPAVLRMLGEKDSQWVK